MYLIYIRHNTLYTYIFIFFHTYYVIDHIYAIDNNNYLLMAINYNLQSDKYIQTN